MAFSNDMIQAVWEKGGEMPDQDPTEWRREPFGAWMHRIQNDDATVLGWKIENLTTGAPDAVENLQPFHRSNGSEIGR